MLSVRILKYSLLSIGVAFCLQSCAPSGARADGSLSFVPVRDWGYLGRDAPKGLLARFKTDNESDLENTPTDPRRLRVHARRTSGEKTIYAIDPISDCPAWGCPKNYNDYLQLYSTFCGARQNFCRMMLYVEERGKFREVFDAPFRFQPDGDNGSKIAFSEQEVDGLPLCFEVKGYSNFSDVGNLLLPKGETDRYVSRYCYNGQKYELDKIYTEPWNWLIELRERNRGKFK
jgi:hypothetical protein